MSKRTSVNESLSTTAALEILTDNTDAGLRVRSQGSGNALEVVDGAGVKWSVGPAGAPSSGSGQALAEALGLVAWSFDPDECQTLTGQTNSRLVGVFIPAGKTITTIAVPVGTAGTTMTAAQLGIYSCATPLATPALAAASANTPSAFEGTTGWIALNLTTPYKTPYSGLYYLGSAYAGTPGPLVLNVTSGNSTVHGALLPNGARKSYHAQLQGTLPDPPVNQGAFSNTPCIIAY